MVGFILQELRYSSSASRDPIYIFFCLALSHDTMSFHLTPPRSLCRLTAIVSHCPHLLGLMLSCLPGDHTNSFKQTGGVEGWKINQLIRLINFSHKILNKMVCNSALVDVVRINWPKLIIFILLWPKSHIKLLNTTCMCRQPGTLYWHWRAGAFDQVLGKRFLRLPEV